MVDAIKQVLSLEHPLRYHWNVTRFNHDKPVKSRQATDADADVTTRKARWKLDPSKLDDAINSLFFWAYAHMMCIVATTIEHITNWVESCPCHGKSAYDSIRQAYRTLHFPLSCPLSGRRLPELAAGELWPIAAELWRHAEGAVLAALNILGLSESDRAAIVLDFNRARQVLSFYLNLKLQSFRRRPRHTSIETHISNEGFVNGGRGGVRGWGGMGRRIRVNQTKEIYFLDGAGMWRFPLVVAGLAHHCIATARTVATRILQLYDSLMLGDALARNVEHLVPAICGHGTECRVQLMGFAAGGVMGPLLKAHCARLKFISVVERLVEGLHAHLHRAVRSAPCHGPVHVALAQRFPMIEARISDCGEDMLNQLSHTLETMRQPLSIIDAMGFLIIQPYVVV